MPMKSQNKDKPYIMYNNEPLENVENFQYVGLEVPSNHRWNECATCCLETRKRAYYVFKSTCNHGEIKSRVPKKIFSTLW